MRYLSDPRPLLCRELVGRERELQELRDALEQAARGQAQFVFLAGEAGVGKTRLCRVFVEESQEQQALVLFGQAISQDQALPLGPFLDAFRRYFSTAAGRLALSNSSLLQANLAFLRRLLPELAPFFPEATLLTFDVSNPPVQQQQALFHSLFAGLQVLAAVLNRPLLLVLEDLHWADETSLELLAFLAQRLDIDALPAPATPVDKSTALMILGTYRAEALSNAPALSRLLLQLHTQRHGRDIRLAPLSATDHVLCVRSILGQPMSEQFAGFLFAWDEGNPFFTEELLGAMSVSGQLHMQSQGWFIPAGLKPQLPSSLTDAILERYKQLPIDDQEVLSYAAVIGREFDFPLLAGLSGLGESELVAVLRRAVNVQLISEVGSTQPMNINPYEPERYQFRHALTREAIYNQMLAAERRLRHKTVAEWFERAIAGTPPNTSTSTRRLDDVARLLAEHYWLAGLPAKARPYALHEADRASRLFSYREERYYLNMAQASLPEDSPERFQLLERIGMLSLGLFDFAEALHWLSMAKAGYQRIGEPYRALQVLANMHLPSWFLASASLPGMLTELETAAEVAFAQPKHANRGVETLVIASRIATYQTTFQCRFRRALRWIERSLALYESLADPSKVPAIQLSVLSRAAIKANQQATVAEEGIAEMRNVLKAALEYRLPEVILFSYAWLAWILVSWGRGAEAEEVLGEAIDFESRSGALRPSFIVGWQRFFSGERWEEGIELLRGEMQRMEQAHVPALVASTGLPLVHLLLAREELDEAWEHLQRIQPVVESLDQYIYLTQLWWGLAKLQLIQGNLPQAQGSYERILNTWKTTEDTLFILPMLLDGTVLYAEVGNRVKARQWLAELQAVMQMTDNPVGAAALLEAEGAVRAREGELKRAIAALRQAVEAWGQLKRGYQQALASQRLAEVLLAWASTEAVGRAARQAAREEADRLLDEALAVYERLQIPMGIQAVHALRSSTQLEAQQRRRRTLETHKPMQGLTQREMQVLLQLAAGKTNKDIAAALSLSTGTVELHVSHILTKLDCETRTQAAAYAIAQGWVKHQTFL